MYKVEYIFKYKIIKDVLPLGGLLLLLVGLNSSVSSPTSEQVCKNRGGAMSVHPW